MLRLLLGLLIVANVVLFLWGRNMTAPAPAAAPAGGAAKAENQVPTIELVRETATVTPTRIEPKLPPVAQEGGEPKVEQQPIAENAKATKPAQPGLNKAAENKQQAQTVALDQETPEPKKSPTPATPTSAVKEEAKVTSAATAPVAEVADECGRIGPFNSPKQLERFASAAGIDASSVEQKNLGGVQGYWVLIPALPDKNQAKEMVAKLKEAGFNDLFLFNDEPMRNTISLGLFSSKENAEKQLAVVQKAGFSAELRTKTTEGSRWWLNYRAPAAKLAKAQLPQGASIEKKACSKTSADTAGTVK